MYWKKEFNYNNTIAILEIDLRKSYTLLISNFFDKLDQ